MNKRILPFLLILFLVASCGGKKDIKGKVDSKDSLSTSMNLINDQLKNDPDNPNLLYERSKLYYNQKMIEKALEDINKAVSMDSSKAPFYLHQSDVYYAMNKIVEARAAIEKSLRLDPKSREANAKMGELQYYLKDYGNAFK